jgi:hypothetical protein
MTEPTNLQRAACAGVAVLSTGRRPDVTGGTVLAICCAISCIGRMLPGSISMRPWIAARIDYGAGDGE